MSIFFAYIDQPMAYINRSNFRSSSSSETTSSFTRARRPALIPPNCSLSLAEAQELVRTRIHQPLLPPPDPQLLQNLWPSSPSSSESSKPEPPQHRTDISSRCEEYPPLNHPYSIKSTYMPAYLRKSHRHTKINWSKAQAHYARDRRLRSCSPRDQNDLSGTDFKAGAQQSDQTVFGPKRKHSAFVIEEELKCQIEDRVGTPHPSDVRSDEDMTPQMNMEELEMGGKVSTYEAGAKSFFPETIGGVTSYPVELM